MQSMELDEIFGVLLNKIKNSEGGGGASGNIPTKVSQLENDSGYIINTVNNLLNYYTKNEIINLISNITTISFEIVETLPIDDISTNIIYLVPSEKDSTNNIYLEYIYINNTWELIGNTTVDLTGYAKEEDIPTKTSDLTNDSGFVTDADVLSTKKGGIVNNTLKVNKVSSTNPSELIELDIHNDGKVAFLTSGNGEVHDSLVHLDGKKNNGTITFNGKVIDIMTPLINIKDEFAKINIFKTLVIAKYGTQTKKLNQIVISDGNEIGFNCSGTFVDRTNSLLYLKNGDEDGETVIRGASIDIYPDQINIVPDNTNTSIKTKNLYISHSGFNNSTQRTYVNMEDSLITLGVQNGNGLDKFTARFHKFEFGVVGDALLEMKGSGNSREVKMHCGTANVYLRNGNLELRPTSMDNVAYILDAINGSLGDNINPWKSIMISLREYDEEDEYDYETSIYNDRFGLNIKTWNENSGDDSIDLLHISGNGIDMYDLQDTIPTKNKYYLIRYSPYGITRHGVNYYIDLDRANTTARYVCESQNSNSMSFYSYDIGNPNSTKNLGTSTYKWSNIYATNGTIQTSDRNEKNTVFDISEEKANALVRGLLPKTYKMNSGSSNRTHWGFISQDIEELLENLGWSSSDFAGFIKSPKEILVTEDENGNPLKEPVTKIVEGEYTYSLRYDEFIAPMIKVIQSQDERIKALEEKLKLLEQKILSE